MKLYVGDDTEDGRAQKIVGRIMCNSLREKILPLKLMPLVCPLFLSLLTQSTPYTTVRL